MNLFNTDKHVGLIVYDRDDIECGIILNEEEVCWFGSTALGFPFRILKGRWDIKHIINNAGRFTTYNDENIND